MLRHKASYILKATGNATTKGFTEEF